MRYSIMLQLVTATTLILVATAALFAWLQNRTSSVDQETVYRSVQGSTEYSETLQTRSS